MIRFWNNDNNNKVLKVELIIMIIIMFLKVELIIIIIIIFWKLN